MSLWLFIINIINFTGFPICIKKLITIIYIQYQEKYIFYNTVLEKFMVLQV